MKRSWLVVGGIMLAVMGLVSGCAGSSPTAAGVTEVDATGFLAAATQPDVVIVDVRSPQEYAEGHLPGSVNISVEAEDFAQRIAQLDPSAQTLVYCRSGRRSTIAADLMVQAGFTNVVNFSSGGAADLAAAGASLQTS
jgi:phage shock protein E